MITPRTLWKSRTSRRRGVVMWVSRGKVCLRFCEGRLNAEKIHKEEDFLRLYKPI